MTINHKKYLGLAFQLAEKNLGKTKLNPSVGSVIVKKNSIISSGRTSIGGRPHAEYNALVGRKNLVGSNLYVTLEPCTHYGFTPPCVNLIVKKKIKNVYYSFDDPDKRTYKKAKNFLKKKKIKVTLIKNDKFKNFYSSYFLNKRFNLPYISAKIAVSKDFYSISKKFKWITNEHSRKIAHLLRSKYDCIISTSKTINLDNALLNCRIKGLENYNPDLFIIDLNLKLKKNLLINKLVKKRKTYLITTKKNLKKTFYFKKIGYKIIFVNSLESKNDFKLLFQQLFKLGNGRVFFETGLTCLNTLINFQLLNNLYVFKSDTALGKNGFNNDSIEYLKKMKLKKEIKVNLNNNSLYKIEF